jgi:hypothetical protein
VGQSCLRIRSTHQAPFTSTVLVWRSAPRVSHACCRPSSSVQPGHDLFHFAGGSELPGVGFAYPLPNVFDLPLVRLDIRCPGQVHDPGPVAIRSGGKCIQGAARTSMRIVMVRLAIEYIVTRCDTVLRGIDPRSSDSTVYTSAQEVRKPIIDSPAVCTILHVLFVHVLTGTVNYKLILGIHEHCSHRVRINRFALRPAPNDGSPAAPVNCTRLALACRTLQDSTRSGKLATCSI